jgi:uncharacterized pyridoxal phosphate-containing UPF0001 family protein
MNLNNKSSKTLKKKPTISYNLQKIKVHLIGNLDNKKMLNCHQSANQ